YTSLFRSSIDGSFINYVVFVAQSSSGVGIPAIRTYQIRSLHGFLAADHEGKVYVLRAKIRTEFLTSIYSYECSLLKHNKNRFPLNILEVPSLMALAFKVFHQKNIAAFKGSFVA